MASSWTKSVFNGTFSNFFSIPAKRERITLLILKRNKVRCSEGKHLVQTDTTFEHQAAILNPLPALPQWAELSWGLWQFARDLCPYKWRAGILKLRSVSWKEGIPVQKNMRTWVNILATFVQQKSLYMVVLEEKFCQGCNQKANLMSRSSPPGQEKVCWSISSLHII